MMLKMIIIMDDDDDDTDKAYEDNDGYNGNNGGGVEGHNDDVNEIKYSHYFKITFRTHENLRRNE